MAAVFVLAAHRNLAQFLSKFNWCSLAALPPAEKTYRQATWSWTVQVLRMAFFREVNSAQEPANRLDRMLVYLALLALLPWEMQKEVDTPGKPSYALHLRKGSQCSKCYASTQESDLDFAARHSYSQSHLVLAAIQCLETSRDPSSLHSQDASSGRALYKERRGFHYIFLLHWAVDAKGYKELWFS